MLVLLEQMLQSHAGYMCVPLVSELHSHKVSAVKEAFASALHPRIAVLCALSWAGAVGEKGKAATDSRPNLIL